MIRLLIIIHTFQRMWCWMARMFTYELERASMCQFKRKHVVYFDTSLNRFENAENANGIHWQGQCTADLMAAIFRWCHDTHYQIIRFICIETLRSFIFSLKLEFSVSHSMPWDCDHITLQIRFMFMFMSILPTITNRIHYNVGNASNNTFLCLLLHFGVRLLQGCVHHFDSWSGHSSGLAQVNVWVHQMKWLWYFVSSRHEHI